MQGLLKRLGPIVMAALVGLTATLFVVSPASAARITTTMRITSPVRLCASAGCGSLGNAPAGTAVRSYCASGAFDFVFSEGAANRVGFVVRTALATGTPLQPTNCFNGGTGRNPARDADLKACASSACTTIGDIASFDNLRVYCLRVAAGVNWVGLFNTNGPQVGFVRASDLSNPSVAGIPTC